LEDGSRAIRAGSLLSCGEACHIAQERRSLGLLAAALRPRRARGHVEIEVERFVGSRPVALEAAIPSDNVLIELLSPDRAAMSALPPQKRRPQPGWLCRLSAQLATC